MELTLPDHPNYGAVGLEFSHLARDFAAGLDEEKRELLEQALDKLASRELGELAVLAAQFVISEDAQDLMTQDADRRAAGRLLGACFGTMADDSRAVGAGYFILLDWTPYKDKYFREHATVLREREVGRQTRTHVQYQDTHIALIRETSHNGYVSAWAVTYGSGQSASVAIRNLLDSPVETRYYDPKSFEKATLGS